MCGRYTIIAKAEEVEKRFNVEVPSDYHPRYNAAPTQVLPVITNESPAGLSFFHWGLIPQWAKNKNISTKLFNARVETLQEKASFKNALKSRRCLIPADGYYEWKKTSKKAKIPYRIILKNKSLFAFAGLWEAFEDENQNLAHTFTIVTIDAPPELSKIHERMPVILNPETEHAWLENNRPSDDYLDLLFTLNKAPMDFYSISSRVNAVQHDSPDLIKPAPAADQFGNLSLFD